MKKETFIVDGMMCANCKATVEKTIKKTNGVKSGSVNLATKKAEVFYDENKTNLEVLKERIEKEGYQVFFLDQAQIYEQKKEKELKTNKTKLIVSIILALIEIYLSMGDMVNIGLPVYTNNPKMYLIFKGLIQIPFVIANVIINFDLFVKGFKNLFRNHPSMESLVSIGCVASFGYSIYSLIINMGSDNSYHYYFESVAMIIALIKLGKYFETKSINKTNNTIKYLLNRTPQKCTKIFEENLIEVDIKDVQIGDILLAKPGDNFAVDGVIVEGYTNVDESMISGESLPIEKNLNDKVFAGTSNLFSVVKYKATGVGQDTLVAKIIKRVEETQASKAPIEKLTDKVASYFTKAVLLLSIIVFIVWFIIGGLEQGLVYAVSVMVIACPCSLGLATPTAIIVGSGVGAKNGLLFKDAETLECMEKIKTFCFDKTGTLTEGDFEVKEIIWSVKEDTNILDMISSLESNSNHLIAKGIVNYLGENNKYKVNDFKEESGTGVSGLIDNKVFKIYKSTKIKDKTILEKANRLSDKGYSVVCVSIDDCESLIIGLGDSIKEEAREVINALHKDNCKVVMITGDNEKAARYVANELKIDKVYSQILPEQKADIIKKIKEKEDVIMIGDGINDAVALSEANVSITFSNSTDIALSSSSLIITTNSLKEILVAKALSKKVFRHIKQNLFFAFFYNSIGILLASGAFIWAGISLNPMIGALAMSFSSVSVVANALRINTFKKEKINGI